MSRRNKTNTDKSQTNKLKVIPNMSDWDYTRAYMPTMEDIRQKFGPARTLGASEDTLLAMDEQLESAGVYSLIQHSLDMGLLPTAQFMGYGALQNIAQNGLIRACIETVADDMTRSWIELKYTGKDESGDSERLANLSKAMKEHSLQSVFHHAAELVGYEGGAFIFIDTGASGEALRLPLHIGRFSNELKNGRLRFTVIDPVNVFPGDYNCTSPLREDYFKPRWWWVLAEQVHASRLIRLTANELPILLKPSYNFLGLPQAQILWDYVLHFQECREAEARLLKKFSLTVFKTSMSDVLFGAGGTQALDSRIRYMIQNMSNDGVLAVDYDKEDVVKLETPLSGVTDIVRQSLEILAALNRTPAVKLLGISPSGFNATGESDIRNYYDHITSQQEKVLRQGLQKALDCIQININGEIDPAITFDFAALGQEDRAALATYQKTKADTIAVYIDRGIISPEEARDSMANDVNSGFAGIDPGIMPDNDPQDMEDNHIDNVDEAGAVFDWSMDGDKIWKTTSNGKHYEVDEDTGEVTKGNIGQADWDSVEAQNIRRDKVFGALSRIEQGESEVTIPELRNDLEKYGGVNDVTLMKGNKNKGLIHMVKRHGEDCLGPVLEAVANGKISRYSDVKKCVAIDKDRYEAILSLDEHGKKKTWLLTGYDIQPEGAHDVNGKFSTRHVPTHTRPTFCRPDMGACTTFYEKIRSILDKIKWESE